MVDLPLLNHSLNGELTREIVTYQNNKSPVSSSTQINFLIFVPCFSLLMTLYIELVHKFAPNGRFLKRYQGLANKRSEAVPYIPYLIFSIEGAISLFYFGGLVALAVFLSKNHVCTGATCMASQADAVFAALSYVLWAASATIRGIEISEFEKRVQLTDDMTKKIIEEA
jgi:hypothetical protein